MRIQQVDFLPCINLNFKGGKQNVSNARNKNVINHEEIHHKKEVLQGVCKTHKDVIYQILEDFEKFGKEQFPDDKVTVFFNAEQSAYSKDRIYRIGLGVNSDAPEGIIRAEGMMPGHSYISKSDFYYTKTIYATYDRGLHYRDLKEHLMGDIKSSVQNTENKEK